MISNSRRIIFVIVFVLLSLIKLFTAKVGLLADPTVQLVIKPYPTISNSFMMLGEETQENILKYKGTWYFEGKYIVITGNEMGFDGEMIYDFLIIAWWISVLIIMMMIAYLIKRRRYKI